MISPLAWFRAKLKPVETIERGLLINLMNGYLTINLLIVSNVPSVDSPNAISISNFFE